ncbi:methionyl-tRNA formyltransferase [Desulfosarcina sp. BuS5]|uniref:methionyl-tRNA formyltransferase n=1 Tax=Desulfosarcina sp. BuS5 TaxID=933262 RepID=UPI000A632519|nr:methionyl-tRNA formyltransferase [Desulfosarcina sp. BuS5]WDN88535.1 methionyl-tRNA formyltransferase [Desulfosarcina sp. BuS5]
MPQKNKMGKDKIEKNKIEKIVFMGTPDFAVPSLKALNQNGYEVSIVVTQPDRPKGRGRKIIPPPVKSAALSLGYDIAQPASVRTDEFAEQITAINPDLFVVTAFGRILPENILAIPRIGAINVHASLLPKYRGSAPIQWAIINGEKKTGVTTMLMDNGLDTGGILLKDETLILPGDTSSILHDRLAEMGAVLLIKTLRRIESDGLKPVPQDDAIATYAPLLNKKDGCIDWKLPAESIESFIRGVTPWPGAFTFHNDRRLKIFKAIALRTDIDENPGRVIKSFPGELIVATGKGALSIFEIQSASGKRLSIRNFLQGNHIPPGTMLGLI